MMIASDRESSDINNDNTMQYHPKKQHVTEPSANKINKTAKKSSILQQPVHDDIYKEGTEVARNRRVLLMVGVFVLTVGGALAIILAVTLLSTKEPTLSPTNIPTALPAENPTKKTSALQTSPSTSSPTNLLVSTALPTNNPTNKPTALSTSPPTKEPTTAPTISSSPTISAFELISSVLSSVIPGFPASDIQERALAWLEADPPTLTALSSSSEGLLPFSSIVQRFVLVVLYYSTTDDNDEGWLNRNWWLSKRSECMWNGINCDESGKVVEISLYVHFLTGSIPTEMGLLTTLAELDFSWNYLTGSIPTEIGLMTDLTSLSLPWNFLTGSIPTEMGLMTDLTHLYLFENNLSGSVPEELDELLAGLGRGGSCDLGCNLLLTEIPTNCDQCIV